MPADVAAAGKGSEALLKLQERDEGGIVALLEDGATGRRICVSCVHLYYDPWWPDVKLLQVGLRNPNIQCLYDQPLSQSSRVSLSCRTRVAKCEAGKHNTLTAQRLV